MIGYDWASATTNGGYPASRPREFINGELFQSLPEQLKSVIVPTRVISNYYSDYGESNYSTTDYGESNYSTTDYLYLLSYNEINSNGPDYRLTKILDYYKTTDNDRTKYFNGNSYGWWLRTVGSGIAFYLVNANGSLEGNVSYIGYGIAPAFRIA